MKKTQWSIAYTTSSRLAKDDDYITVKDEDELVELARKYTRLPLEVEDYTDQLDIFTRGRDGRRRKFITFMHEGTIDDEVNDTPRLVFVYGTLKSGYHNNDLITSQGGTLVGFASTVRPMYMQDGGFPYVYDIDNADLRKAPIDGEVWRVSPDTLARLDRLEGTPNHYQRRTVEVTTVGGTIYAAEMYVVTNRAPRTRDTAHLNAFGHYEWRP